MFFRSPAQALILGLGEDEGSAEVVMEVGMMKKMMDEVQRWWWRWG